MYAIKTTILTLLMIFCITDTLCNSRLENYIPAHVTRLSVRNKPELDVKTLAVFALLGFGSGVLCHRLEPACTPVLQIMYLYLWGQVEANCVEKALYELQQQGVTISPSMTEYLFWVASWTGYFTSLAD